jgi:hypothetical protein
MPWTFQASARVPSMTAVNAEEQENRISNEVAYAANTSSTL